MKLERVEQIYSALEKYEIELDPDPQTRGPKYLQGVIAMGRNYMNAVSQLLLEVHREKQTLARDLRAREAAFQASFDHMLANDERVRRLPNIEDRKSTCRIYLRDDIQAIEGLKAQIGDVEYVEKAIRHRHRELVSTMNEIKLQKGLIQAEIGTGAFYGDERVAPDGSSIGTGRGPLGISTDDVIDEASLDQLFDQEQAAQAKAPVQPTTPAPPPVEEPVAVAPPPPPAPVAAPQPIPEPTTTRPTEEDVLRFLGAAGEPAGGVSVTAEDFDALLQNI